MKYFFIGLLVLIIGGLLFLIMNKSVTETIPTHDATVRYVPIGDSYTAGVGVPKDRTFPELLTKHLREEGIDIVLVTNPAVSGFTTHDAITIELPILSTSDANLVTVLIGANDIFLKTPDQFAGDYTRLLDGIKKEAPDSRIILMTIPDFSYTPHAQSFGYSEEQIREEIIGFNTKIKEQAKKRDLPIVDLYEATTSLGYDPKLFIDDEFHPSTEQFVIWEKAIFPVVNDTVK